MPTPACDLFHAPRLTCIRPTTRGSTGRLIAPWNGVSHTPPPDWAFEAPTAISFLLLPAACPIREKRSIIIRIGRGVGLNAASAFSPPSQPLVQLPFFGVRRQNWSAMEAGTWSFPPGIQVSRGIVGCFQRVSSARSLRKGRPAFATPIKRKLTCSGAAEPGATCQRTEAQARSCPWAVKTGRSSWDAHSITKKPRAQSPCFLRSAVLVNGTK